MNYLVIIFCIIYAVLNVTGTGLIKNELLIFQPKNLIQYFYFFLRTNVILGLFLNFLSVIATIKALSLTKFSYVVPIAIGINFILTILIGYFIFKDHLSAFSYIGITFILLGIFFINL